MLIYVNIQPSRRGMRDRQKKNALPSSSITFTRKNDRYLSVKEPQNVRFPKLMRPHFDGMVIYFRYTKSYRMSSVCS